MKWWGYALCIMGVIASLPLSIAFSKTVTRKGDAAGVTMMVGLALITVTDPKTAVALEQIDKRRELGDVEQDAEGDGDGGERIV
ncbi:MAG TPA: hypothetical protein VNR60_14090 [Croceibacterium sp.]|nr:hypothetical protein [Croceibacterium sp.]